MLVCVPLDIVTGTRGNGGYHRSKESCRRSWHLPSFQSRRNILRTFACRLYVDMSFKSLTSQIPSFAGYIKDKRGSYNLSYWIAGSFILCTVTQFSLVRVYTGARPATEETIKELEVETEEFFTSKDCNDEKMTISNNKEIDLEN